MMILVVEEPSRFVFLHLCRDRVRERCAGRSTASFAASDSAVGLRAPRKQVLLVPDTGGEVTLMFFTVQTCILNDLCSGLLLCSCRRLIRLLFSAGCCRHRIWREVGALPASQDVCQQQQQPFKNFHTNVGAESEE